MYQRKQPKSDTERFLDAFKRKVGASPEEYLRRKLAAGVNEDELRRLYDMLAVEIARRAHCTALKYDSFSLQKPQAAQRHRESAARATVPVCARCGARMVLRTAQKGARKGQRFWGCSNYPVCRYTQEYEDGARK